MPLYQSFQYAMPTNSPTVATIGFAIGMPANPRPGVIDVMVDHERLCERGVNHPNRTRHMGLRATIKHVGNIAKGTQDNLFINRFLLICRSKRPNALVELLPFFRKCSHDASLRFSLPRCRCFRFRPAMLSNYPTFCQQETGHKAQNSAINETPGNGRSGAALKQ